MLHKEGVFFSEQLSKLQFTSALEVGCGHGRMLRYTIQNNGSRFIVGLDFGYPQLKKAQLALAGQCHLVQASALDLPFADNTFDLVYCVGVLMHIPPSSVQKTLSETVRVSRKYVLFAEGIYNHFNMFGLDFRKEYEAVGLKTLSCVLKPFQGLRPKPVQFAVMEKGASIK
jgi:ubiquinone/menaquinone biosynthesis C-methylase UbiE